MSLKGLGLNFDHELIPATLIKRYKRFLADAKLDCGTQITAHCPNTGSMKTCGSPGDRIYLSHNDSPKRKLAYTWELTQTKGGFIGINTHRPNKLVLNAIKDGQIAELSGYQNIRAEVPYGDRSRIDILLEEGKRPPCYVEVKNVTLLVDDQLAFPDAVSERGLKHIKELEKQLKLGNRAVMFFLVNRPEGDYFRPAKEIDPTYSKALETAQKAGVEVLIYRCSHSLNASKITEKLSLKWS